VNEGTLQILAGATVGAGDVEVATGAIFALNGTVPGSVDASGFVLGSGSIAGIVTLNAGGTLMPGDGIGRLSAGGLVAPAGNSIRFDIAGASSADQLRITGSVVLGATLVLNVLPAYVPAFGSVFALIDNDGSDPISGTFAGLPQDARLNSGAAIFAVSYTGNAATGTFSGAGNDFMLMSIPEPGIAVNIAAGLSVLMFIQRGRRRFRY
jgi:hypothetical protein